MNTRESTLAVTPVPAGARTSAGRNAAIDMTKGLLVLLMVVYHSVNYFSADKTFLRYIHFLPASFIFITGYLVTAVLQPKLEAGDRRVQFRLMIRGVRLLLIFLALNFAAHAAFTTNYNHRRFGIEVLSDELPNVLLFGGQRLAVFEVLLPISYLLVFSGALLMVSAAGARRAVVWLAGLAGFVGCVILTAQRSLFFNLELLSMGLLGLVAGLLTLRASRRPWTLAVLLLTNAAYVTAVVFVYPSYEMNIVGVCLALALFVDASDRLPAQGWLAQWLALLGRYSLVGYIVQIAVLQLVFRAVRSLGLPGPTLAGAMVITAVLTTAMVGALAFARSKSRLIDSSYRAVLA